jgi:uncharacterized damage-inducible protein DinB
MTVLSHQASAERKTGMELRYPIGEYQSRPVLTTGERSEAIGYIAVLPRHLREAVSGLSAQQLEARYRPGGWTVRQVVHHISDSHVNAYVRTKLAVTEDDPVIKPYDEKAWAELADNREIPIYVSLGLVEALHLRWEAFLRSLPPADFARSVRHPERGTMTLDDLVAHYAWHGRHHVAHITSLRIREGWT